MFFNLKSITLYPRNPNVSIIWYFSCFAFKWWSSSELAHFPNTLICFNDDDDDDDDNDDELFLWYGWLTKDVKTYFQLGPQSEIHRESLTCRRIWTYTEPEFRLSWMKLCSCVTTTPNSGYSTASCKVEQHILHCCCKQRIYLKILFFPAKSVFMILETEVLCNISSKCIAKDNLLEFRYFFWSIAAL